MIANPWTSQEGPGTTCEHPPGLPGSLEACVGVDVRRMVTALGVDEHWVSFMVLCVPWWWGERIKNTTYLKWTSNVAAQYVFKILLGLKLDSSVNIMPLKNTFLGGRPAWTYCRWDSLCRQAALVSGVLSCPPAILPTSQIKRAQSDRIRIQPILVFTRRCLCLW